MNLTKNTVEITVFSVGEIYCTGVFMKLARGTLIVQFLQIQRSHLKCIQPVTSFQKTTFFYVASLLARSFVHIYWLQNHSENLLSPWAITCGMHFWRTYFTQNSTTEFLLQGYEHPMCLSWYKEVSDQEDTPQLITKFWTSTNIIPCFVQIISKLAFQFDSCPPRKYYEHWDLFKLA